MGRTLYAYADQLWEVKQRFTYTGEAREFTLDPGKYLFICNGAAGGGTDATKHWGYGASAYGIFETNQSETMYAVVGGNGIPYDQGTSGTPTPGGFNGGGNGGYYYTTDYQSGGSGGGASDIRLTMDETLVPPVYHYNLPNEYLELEDIHLQWEEKACIITNYHTKPNTRMLLTVRFSPLSIERKTGWQCLYGTRQSTGAADDMWFAVRDSSSNHHSPMSSIVNNRIQPSVVIPCDEKLTITYDALNSRVSWLSESGKTYEINHTKQITAEQSTYPLIIFTMTGNNGNPSDEYVYGMRFYECKIYEDDPDGVLPSTLVHHYIPAQRNSDGMVGVYDLIDQIFIAYTPHSSGHRMFGKPYPSNSKTLLSRILVAGGGGGDAKYINRGYSIMSYGGGKTAGFVGLKDNNSAYSQTDLLPASQDEGYAFGKGADGWRKDSNASSSNGREGAGGGGGGWFGGYTEEHYNASYSSIGGSGGSSYALTADSWKPYGYIPTSHYYLTNTALVGCQTTNGSILICTPIKSPAKGDIIIVPFTGKTTKIETYPGIYNAKCYGGEGGISFENGTSFTRYAGGYSEGTFSIKRDKTDIYAVVGGSGLFYRGHSGSSKFEILNELASYNGGGTTITDPVNYWHVPWSGGGATDLRLSLDTSPVHEPIPDTELRDDIPEEYTQLKAIFMENDYIKFGYIPKTDTTLKLDVELIRFGGSYHELFGADPYFNFYSYAMGRSIVVINSIESSENYLMPLNTRLNINTTNNSLSWSDGYESHTLTTTSTMIDSSVELYFGSMNRSGPVDYSPANWYSIKIYESENIVHDLVPVKRNSDNVMGFYDVISETFITPMNGSSYNAMIPISIITYESKTLMSRFIVAGGAGGMGYNSSKSGKGGGEVGGTCTTGNGTNAGPGTQTSSPINTADERCSGGFGYGGMGLVKSSGRGGAGGGGWFGGSGTCPNGSTDNDLAGSGGSGYILTEESYKPDYYIPSEDFYLSEASTTLGGNDLLPNISKIEIEVIKCNPCKAIIHDSEGYKEYDEENEQWVWFADEVSEEDVEEHGSYVLDNFTGVQNEFDVIIHDPNDVSTYADVVYWPNGQKIDFLIPRTFRYAREVIDASYDDAVYDLSTKTKKWDNEYNSYIVTIEKKIDTDSLFKLYSIQLFAN